MEDPVKTVDEQFQSLAIEDTHEQTIRELASKVTDVDSAKRLLEYVLRESVSNAYAKSSYRHPRFKRFLDTCLGKHNQERFTFLWTCRSELPEVHKDYARFCETLSQQAAKLIEDQLSIISIYYPVYLDVSDELTQFKEWYANRDSRTFIVQDSIPFMSEGKLVLYRVVFTLEP
jgi:hypothetical protein